MESKLYKKCQSELPYNTRKEIFIVLYFTFSSKCEFSSEIIRSSSAINVNSLFPDIHCHCDIALQHCQLAHFDEFVYRENKLSPISK